jgi:hypothetical protein
MRKIYKIGKSMIAVVVALLLVCPFPAIAQEFTAVEWWDAPQQILRAEELDQMLAPIALYPDALLAQVLAAATYPRGIAAADRFAKANPRANSEDLFYAARDADWSPSVKAMLQFPDILAMMNEYPDWTAKMGNAFLSQQGDVIDSVQRLRQWAYTEGMLRTTTEQVVRFDQRTGTIYIEPAQPRMVYVPVYNPEVAYGTWRYADYPPQRYYYPSYRRESGSGSGVLSFLAGILVDIGRGWGGWDFDWQQRRSQVQVDNYNDFVGRSYSNPDWFQLSQDAGRTVYYDTDFRRNAGYRDYLTAQQIDQRQVPVLMTTGQSVSGVQTRSLAPAVGVSDASIGTLQGTSVDRKDSAERLQATSPSMKGAGSRGGSDVSQAAHTAKSEGLKGQDLSGRVHEAIDTRKESKDARKADRPAAVAAPSSRETRGSDKKAEAAASKSGKSRGAQKPAQAAAPSPEAAKPAEAAAAAVSPVVNQPAAVAAPSPKEDKPPDKKEGGSHGGEKKH